MISGAVLLASLSFGSVLAAVVFIIVAIAVVASLWVPLPKNTRSRSGNGGYKGRGNSDRQPRYAVPAPSSVPCARPAIGCPNGKYLSWPTPVFCALLLLGICGAAVGSGGTGGGFVIALILNPILWVACVVTRYIGRIRCPHCRKSSVLGFAAKHPVGSAIACGNCGNDFAKPPG